MFEMTLRELYRQAYRDVRLSLYRGQAKRQANQNGKTVLVNIPRVALSKDNPLGGVAYMHWSHRNDFKTASNRYRRAMLKLNSNWTGRENSDFPWEIIDKLNEVRKTKGKNDGRR